MYKTLVNLLANQKSKLQLTKVLYFDYLKDLLKNSTLEELVKHYQQAHIQHILKIKAKNWHFAQQQQKKGQN